MRPLAPPANSTPRQAAVLIPLAFIESEIFILFTLRREDLTHHGGEISFPGGNHEKKDGNCIRTALRETHEEIGLPSQAVQVLGQLTPLYIFPSRYIVHPIVGWIPNLPPLRPNAREVARILQVPLNLLLQPETIQQEIGIRNGTTITIPYYEFQAWHIWGATAMLLSELLVLTEQLLENSSC
ncbi:MAG TPA: CoA pyrophosphatase [Thermoflexia bacterium]|nr:CoA pyrophosphatase [Thermoflexia bacterium]